METFLSWSNSVASWYVDLAVGWQLFFALLVLVPVCYVLAQFVVLPIVDGCRRAWQRWVFPVVSAEPDPATTDLPTPPTAVEVSSAEDVPSASRGRVTFRKAKD